MKPIILMSSLGIEMIIPLPGSISAVGLNPATPHAVAVMEAIAAEYSRVTGRAMPTASELKALENQPVTVLIQGQNFLDATEICAIAGIASMRADHSLILRDENHGPKEIVIEPGCVLDIEPEPGQIAILRERVEHVHACLPEVEALTPADLLALPEPTNEPGPITLIVFGCGRPHSTGVGALWLLNSFRREDGIAHGYLICRDTDGPSGEGSIPAGQLLTFGGRVVDPPAIDATEATAWCALPYPEALARFAASPEKPQT